MKETTITSFDNSTFESGTTTLPFNNTVQELSTGNRFEYGAIFIERAFIEWNRFEFAKVRAGRLLTPFGIWSHDHGAPALTSVRLPALVAPSTENESIPLQVTGFELLGTVNLPAEFIVDYSVYVANTFSEIEPVKDKYTSKNVGFYLNFTVPTVADFIDIEFGASMFFGKREKLAKTDAVYDGPPPAVSKDNYYYFKQNDIVTSIHLKLKFNNLPLDGTLVLQSEYMLTQIEEDKNANLIDQNFGYMMTSGFSFLESMANRSGRDYSVQYFYLQVEYQIFGWITPYYRFNYIDSENENFYSTYKTMVQHVSGVNIKPYAPVTIKVEHVFMNFIDGTKKPESDFHMFQTSISLAF
ncbi:hypothetical protein ACFL20_09935 [Spirochaetota bacterium]